MVHRVSEAELCPGRRYTTRHLRPRFPGRSKPMSCAHCRKWLVRALTAFSAAPQVWKGLPLFIDKADGFRSALRTRSAAAQQRDELSSPMHMVPADNIIAKADHQLGRCLSSLVAPRRPLHPRAWHVPSDLPGPAGARTAQRSHTRAIRTRAARP